MPVLSDLCILCGLSYSPLPYNFNQACELLRLPLVSSDTTTSVANPSGIVTMPGWLNGMSAFSFGKPYTLANVSALSKIQASELTIPTITAAITPWLVVRRQKSNITKDGKLALAATLNAQPTR